MALEFVKCLLMYVQFTRSLYVMMVEQQVCIEIGCIVVVDDIAHC